MKLWISTPKNRMKQKWLFFSWFFGELFLSQSIHCGCNWGTLWWGRHDWNIAHFIPIFFLWSSIEVTMEGQMQFVSDCKIQRRREDLAWFITKILSQQRSYVTWLSRCVTIKVTMQLQWNAAELLKPTFFYLWRQAKNRNKT